MIRRKKSDSYWLAATVGTVLTVGILTVIPVVTARSGALWITDDGNKWMVVENLIRHHSPEIVNPAAGLDPENQFFPDAVFHFQRFRGAIRSIFPEFFPDPEEKSGYSMRKKNILLDKCKKMFYIDTY